MEVVAWAAGNGDRSENADYQYSKRRLRQIDGRVRILTKRIEAAEVVDPEAPRTGQRATKGVLWSHRALCECLQGSERVVSIVGTDEVDLDRNHISWASPLGRALMGAAEDDEVDSSCTRRHGNPDRAASPVRTHPRGTLPGTT